MRPSLTPPLRASPLADHCGRQFAPTRQHTPPPRLHSPARLPQAHIPQRPRVVQKQYVAGLGPPRVIAPARPMPPVMGTGSRRQSSPQQPLFPDEDKSGRKEPKRQQGLTPSPATMMDNPGSTEDHRRKIRYIQRIMPSATYYEILKCLQENNFHVRKTVEALVDKFTIIAANTEQSRLLVAQSIAYYNDVNRIHETHSPQNSFVMKLQNEFEKPVGLTGEQLEQYGMLQPPPQLPDLHADEDFTPAKFVSHIPDQLIPPSGKKKALLIGINYYGSKKELNGCCDDVMRMKRLISSVYGFLDKPAFLTVLTDKPGGDPRLLPTKKNILCAMSWLVDSAEKGDVLFFHFSGHGGQKKDLSGTEIDGFDETIMPLDYKKAGHITDDEIHNVMIKGLKNGVKLISVMDCCHSGSGMDLPFYYERQGWKQELFPKFSEGDVQLFSSCQDSETAADLMIPSWGAGGAVTLAIVSALSQKPFGWTFASLLNQIQLFLSERKFTQKPQLSSTQKFDLNRRFNFQEITANTNKMIGAKNRRRHRPRTPAEQAHLVSPRYPQNATPRRAGTTPRKQISPANELAARVGTGLRKILTGV